MLKLFTEQKNVEVDYNQLRQEELDRISVLLQEKRQSQGWDIESISTKIHITKNVLRAIENADLHRLPEPVFIKELLKKYSDFLGMNIDDHIEKFPTKKNKKHKNKSSYKNIVNPFNLNINFNSKYLYIIYVALLFFSVKSLNDMLKPTPFTIQDSIENQNMGNQLEESTVTNNPPTPSQNQTENSTIPVVEENVSNPEQLKVNLKAQDDSWVRVIIDGDTQFEGILTKGTEREWVAKKEFTIRAGNAGGLLISVNEETPKQIGQLGQVEEITLNL